MASEHASTLRVQRRFFDADATAARSKRVPPSVGLKSRATAWNEIRAPEWLTASERVMRMFRADALA
jgi:hypothetical protein